MKIGWITVGNLDVGSTRLGVYIHHLTLQNNNYESVIISMNDEFYPDIKEDIESVKSKIVSNKITHLILQKVCGVNAQEIVHFCRQRNIKTVFASGDWYETAMLHITDGVWVGSSYIEGYLKIKYPNKNVFVIEDPIEVETDYLKEFTNNIPVIGWYGNLSKLPYVQSFLNDVDLFSISNTEDATVTMGAGTSTPWDTSQLINILLKKIDIIIVPVDMSNAMVAFAKTANRITLPMSLGIPVICSPIPSYVQVIQNNINGFLCNFKEEFYTSIEKLHDIETRKTIGRYSVGSIKQMFSKEKLMGDIINNLKLL